MNYIIFFLMAFDIGLFKLPNPYIYAVDFIHYALLYYTIRQYFNGKVVLNKSMKRILILWLIFSLYVAYSIYSSKAAQAFNYLLLYARDLYPYYMFFYIPIFIKTREDITKVIFFLNVFCIIGGILAIMQSFYGATPMFDIKNYYHIGYWSQPDPIAGNLVRVMLPTLFMIEMMFFYNVFEIMFRKYNTKNALLAVFYLIPIFIGFARSHWAGVVICLTLIIVLMSRYQSGKAIGIAFKVFLGTVVMIILLNFLENLLGLHIIETLTDRVTLMFFDLQNKSGTLESRIDTLALSLVVWQQNPIFGVDYNYMILNDWPALSDIGYTYVLVSIGAAGLLLLFSWFITSVRISLRYLLVSFKSNNVYGSLFSALYLVNMLYFVIIQQYTQNTFDIACLSITGGLFIVSITIQDISNKKFNTISNKNLKSNTQFSIA